MRYQPCLVRHQPPETYGDCIRACVASIMEFDGLTVPHFVHDGCDFHTSIERLREWLKTYNRHYYTTYFPSTIELGDLLAFMGEHNPDVPYMLFSEGHVVVCIGGKIEHDPAWYHVKLKTPVEQWVIGIIV